MKYLAVALVGAGLAASMAVAQPVTSDQARDLLFPTRGYAVALSPDLSAAEQQIVKAVIDLSAEQNSPLNYYASIAFSPADGLQSESLQGSANHHGIAAADAAALAACGARASGGRAACTIAARVLPRGYQERPLTLSKNATISFDREYRRGRGEKAFAASPATGQWAIATGSGAAAAARNQCDRKAAARGVSDCEIVVAD